MNNEPTWMARHRRFEPESKLVGKPVQGGRKAPDRRLTRRLYQDGKRTYVCYSADELLAIESAIDEVRPGHPV